MTLEVEVRPYPKKRYAYNRNLVLVRFVNTTNRPIKILRPLDGSLWCYYVPYYKFDVRDAKGAGMKLPIPDDVWGLWAGMRWPEDYVVEIRPGESFEKEIGIEHLIRRDGKYKVTFSYVYLSDKTNPLSLKYPYGLWEGTATSRTAEIELRKN